MDTPERSPATLDQVLARLADLEAARAEQSDAYTQLREDHVRQQDQITALQRENAALRRPAPRFGRKPALPAAAAPMAPTARTSRRGMLGTAAKVAVATAAAGVLVEQVGTRPAFASAGNFSSNTPATPAVTAAGTSGAEGVNATSDSSWAVAATSGTGSGVLGSGSSYGVYGTTSIGTGIYGVSVSGDGAYGSTGSGGGAYGVHGVNTSNLAGGIAVFGHSDDGAGHPGPGIGVAGDAAGGIAIQGTATSGYGVFGTVGGGVAVYGQASDGIGVIAASGTDDGLQAYGGGGTAVAVRAAGGTGVGVYGTSIGGGAKQALFGVGTSGATGLRATSDTGNGIVALSTSGTGINVQSSTGSAVVATSNGVGYGLYLTAPSGWAIGCVGRVRVIGAAVGTATLAHGTTSKQVTTAACSGASQVILTPTSNPGVFIWAVASPGYFTIYASSAPTADVTFSYFLIN